MVVVPDDNNSLDVLGLFSGVFCHTFDQLEPFVAIEANIKSVLAQVGKSRAAEDMYQDFPLSVNVTGAVSNLGD